MTQRHRRPGLYERATRRLVCGSCLGTIASGSNIVRDVTRRAHHPECKRRGVRPHVDLLNPERLNVSPFDGLGKPAEAPRCPGCGRHVTGEHWRESVTVQGIRWHGDCKKRAARVGGGR